MSVQHYKNGQLSIIAGAGGIGGGGGEESFTGTKAEVEQAIAAGQIKENWTVYITDDIEEVVPDTSDYKIEYITQEEYDALGEEKYENDIEYHITDGGINNIIASNIEYDNSVSGLEATTVQSAVDELKDDVSTLNESLAPITLSSQIISGDMIKANYSSLIKVGNICILSVLCNTDPIETDDILFELPVTTKFGIPVVLLTNVTGYRLQCGLVGNKLKASYSTNSASGLATLSGVIVFVTD